jgi:hypothetical protein
MCGLSKAYRSEMVEVNVFLARSEGVAAFNRVCSPYLVAPSSVRTTIICSLPVGVLVEVDGVAVLD